MNRGECDRVRKAAKTSCETEDLRARLNRARMHQTGIPKKMDDDRRALANCAAWIGWFTARATVRATAVLMDQTHPKIFVPLALLQTAIIGCRLHGLAG